MAQKSKLPSSSNLSREMIAYHQGVEGRIDNLQTTVDEGVVSTIDDTSGAFTLGYGLDRSSQELFATLSSSYAALSGNVTLNNTANYFDGPSLSLGAGTYFVMGKVLVSAGTIPTETYAKLWDGTTVIDSGSTENVNATRPITLALAGIITLASASTVKISCRNPNSTDGTIYANQSGNSKDSSITAVRLTP